jgi:hypothetical protein
MMYDMSTTTHLHLYHDDTTDGSTSAAVERVREVARLLILLRSLPCRILICSRALWALDGVIF